MFHLLESAADIVHGLNSATGASNLGIVTLPLTGFATCVRQD